MFDSLYLPIELVTVFAFIYGTVFASFVGVLSYRIPLDKSIVTPGSHCTSCSHDLGVLDLIPVLSCLFYRARCRYCKTYYGYAHLFLELITGCAFAVIAYFYFGEWLMMSYLLLLTLLYLYCIGRVVLKNSDAWLLASVVYLVTHYIAYLSLDFTYEVPTSSYILIFGTFLFLNILTCIYLPKRGNSSNGN